MRRVTQESHVGYVFRKLDDAQAFRMDVLASGLCEAEPGTSIEVDELEPGKWNAEIIIRSDATGMSVTDIEDRYLNKLARRHRGRWSGT